MLIKFSFSNFRSFRDRQDFNLIAVPRRNNEKDTLESNVFKAGEYELLKTKAIYGPNASGKSNLTQALDVFCLMVASSVKEEKLTEHIWNDRFKLISDWDTEPMLFELTFLHAEKLYRYGFAIVKDKVVNEWLFARLQTKEVTLFVRTAKKVDVRNAYFPDAEHFIKLFQDNAHELFRPDALFLTGAALMGHKLAAALRKKILSIVVVNGLDSSIGAQISMGMLDKGDALAIKEILAAADPSIQGVDLKEVSEETLNELPASFRQSLQERKQDGGKLLYSYHNVYDAEGNKVKELPTFFGDWESTGTKKIFRLSGVLLNALANGTPLVIDEFDANIHPSFTRKIIELFHNASTNPRNAQLIFVTHDASLLNRIELRRDQVSFIDKDSYGVSSITDLAQYKGVRKDSSYEKEYLQGKYGAVPFWGNIDHIIQSAFKKDDIQETK